ncbi:glycosyltransferase family 4 protein [Modestobacter sp. VKM Ac-2983]|uniref:glycosyltransferase family 4 protein n=1 Tax=Modestobacter sp. VKM Ac-2983 TaxID=3004137 RepID=UPI0022AB9AF0|nr:glycosyltransferase family 4 protein [Modestobacter sp. VKM Ac-2983]MCZ2804102.1 glycosyltransferase family 4 protein [Modestobacter sp. VKM Ac-2983]
MRKTRHRRARVYDSVRSAHLERAHALAPASVLHRRWRYDFDPALTTGLDLVRGGTLSMAVTIARSGLLAVEVNEPLLRHVLWRTAVAVTAARLAARVRRSEVLIVSYAIENRDNYAPEPTARLRRRVRTRVDWVLSRYTARQLDRIAYGTSASAELYASLLGTELATCSSTVVPALPAACTCAAAEERDADQVVFVGAFSARKGLAELVAAWPEVVRELPTARLSLVGQGAMEDLARELAERVPGVDVVVAPAREEIHRVLRRATVLVLLSQRTPTWREQVGLPIVEGMSHGCTVVTTEETGLADWLAGHGHEVVAAGASTADVAAAISGALRRRRSAVSVLAELPGVDGRLAADRWLFRPGPD